MGQVLGLILGRQKCLLNCPPDVFLVLVVLEGGGEDLHGADGVGVGVPVHGHVLLGGVEEGREVLGMPAIQKAMGQSI